MFCFMEYLLMIGSLGWFVVFSPHKRIVLVCIGASCGLVNHWSEMYCHVRVSAYNAIDHRIDPLWVTH